MNDINFFKDLISNCNILYIPIISSINRDTQKYNLDADGNVNRFITTFYHVNSFKSLLIYLPNKHTSCNLPIDFCSYINANMHNNTKVNIKYSNNFGIHAGEQRNKPEVYKKLFLELIKNNDIESFDYIICESQQLCKLFASLYSEKTIFWNPVSEVPGKTRIFTKDHVQINDELFNMCKYTILAAPDQYNYYININKDKIIYIDKLLDRSIKLFDYTPNKDILNTLNKFKSNDTKIYYLPYRMTDEGYCMDDVINIFRNEKNNYIILYCDPNNSHYDDSLPNDIKSHMIKVPMDRNTYYTIIDFDYVIIPYLEDLDFINHAAIHEFMHTKSKCHIILKQPTYFNISNLKNRLIIY